LDIICTKDVFQIDPFFLTDAPFIEYIIAKGKFVANILHNVLYPMNMSSSKHLLNHGRILIKKIKYFFNFLENEFVLIPTIGINCECNF
jgi:hypothetical protein